MIHKLKVGMRFGVCLGLSIFVTVVAAAYLSGSARLQSEKTLWNAQLVARLDLLEARLSHFQATAQSFSENSYVSNGIIDVIGRSAYLPRELENMDRTPGIAKVLLTDFNGGLIAWSGSSEAKLGLLDIVRSTINSGKPRAWCDAEHELLYMSQPVNYYNTPQGALIVAIDVPGVRESITSKLQASQSDGTFFRVGCAGVPLFNEEKKIITPQGWMYEISLKPDPVRHPMQFSLKMDISAGIPYLSLFLPVLIMIGKIFVLGLVFMYIGGMIAKNIELELIEARDLAVAATAARSQLLANMSHEIRTPLNGILVNLEFLHDEITTVDKKKSVDDALSSGQILLRLLNDILDFSKIESGFMILDLAPFDLVQVIQSLENSFGNVSNDKGLALKMTIEPDVANWVHGDSLRIRQILNNLVSNALKFTAHGAVSVRVSVGSHDNIIFEVSDSGIGIAAHNIKKLFKPFIQAESGTTRKFGGTGLGLSISLQLATLMGGDITLESEEGKGTTARLTARLPACRAPSEVMTQSVLVDFGIVPPLRILVAEDNLINQSLMKRLLLKSGHTVVIANNGEEALVHLLNGVFDVIFMDCQMPVMDGYVATSKIIELYRESRPIIIALTANAFKEDQDRCFAVGMDLYLSKPINKLKLHEILLEARNRIRKVS